MFRIRRDPHLYDRVNCHSQILVQKVQDCLKLKSFCLCCGSGRFIPDPGSNFFPFRIPDPKCLHPGSRIRIKEFKYFNPKKTKKMFLSSRIYDPGCSSRIPDPDADFLTIPEPGVKKALDPGSATQVSVFTVW